VNAGALTRGALAEGEIEGDAVNALLAFPDDEVVTMTISGAQLKALWGEVDFAINPIGFQYNGNANQGSGVDVYGRQVGVNIDHLGGYFARGSEGMNYFVLHEVAHMTSGGINLMNTLVAGGLTPAEHAQLERYTNDVALAIGNATGHTLIPDPGYGYTGG